MHDAVVSKLIAASRGSPCDSMASCFMDRLCVCVRACVVEWKVQETQSCHIFKYAWFDGLSWLWPVSKIMMSVENENTHDGVDIYSGCCCWDAIGCGGWSESEMQTPKGNIMTWSTWPSHAVVPVPAPTHAHNSHLSLLARRRHLQTSYVSCPAVCIARSRYERLQTNIVCDRWSAGVRCIVLKISAKITTFFTSLQIPTVAEQSAYSQRMWQVCCTNLF